jgi:leucyl/phenylalanyl-tRNA---protein transferase
VPQALPPDLLLEAYAAGYFPMADKGEILWFCPEMRGVIPLDEKFHIPHGLAKVLKKTPFEIRWNTAFREVMLGCAGREETWIDGVILESYCTLHRMGYAHSVECWDAEGLQGGLYGVALPGVFFGESMFSKKTNASKIALVALVDSLRKMHFQLLDIQWVTDHLMQFGAYELPRDEYLTALKQALAHSGNTHRGLNQ